MKIKSKGRLNIAPFETYTNKGANHCLEIAVALIYEVTNYKLQYIRKQLIQIFCEKSSDCLHVKFTIILNVILTMESVVKDTVLNKISFVSFRYKSYFIWFPLSLKRPLRTMFSIC